MKTEQQRDAISEAGPPSHTRRLPQDAAKG